MDDLWDDYLQYLLCRGRLEERPTYGRLLRLLHNTPFTWEIPRDENRAADGIHLRRGYEIPRKYEVWKEEFLDRECSVLEMLLGLSIRIDNEILGDPAEEHPERLFWEMIRNLGLDAYRGRYFSESLVNDRIQMWMQRFFSSDGVGSIFPLRHARRDQRKVEIWDQMYAYVSENYE